jgi:hypothetical protein
MQTVHSITINEVAGGQTTSYQGITTGACVATAVIENEPVSPVLGFSAESAYNYTIVVANTTPPTLKISSEKQLDIPGLDDMRLTKKMALIFRAITVFGGYSVIHKKS